MLMREEEDYISVNDSIEIEEIQIKEKKPPNDKIIAQYVVEDEKKG